MAYLLQFDGGSRGNPGPSGAGFVVYDESGKIIKEGFCGCGHNTNNFAEYTGVLNGLKFCATMPNITQLKIQGDSKLVIEHLKGNWRCKAPNLVSLFNECKNILKQIPHQLEWIPRAKNSYADTLSNQGMDLVV